MKQTASGWGVTHGHLILSSHEMAQWTSGLFSSHLAPYPHNLGSGDVFSATAGARLLAVLLQLYTPVQIGLQIKGMRLQIRVYKDLLLHDYSCFSNSTLRIDNSS